MNGLQLIDGHALLHVDLLQHNYIQIYGAPFPLTVAVFNISLCIIVVVAGTPVVTTTTPPTPTPPTGQGGIGKCALICSCHGLW